MDGSAAIRFLQGLSTNDGDSTAFDADERLAFTEASSGSVGVGVDVGVAMLLP